MATVNTGTPDEHQEPTLPALASDPSTALEFFRFFDVAGKPCAVVEGGNVGLHVGRDGGGRMILDQNQARAVAGLLLRWAATGSMTEP